MNRTGRGYSIPKVSLFATDHLIKHPLQTTITLHHSSSNRATTLNTSWRDKYPKNALSYQNFPISSLISSSCTFLTAANSALSVLLSLSPSSALAATGPPSACLFSSSFFFTSTGSLSDPVHLFFKSLTSDLRARGSSRPVAPFFDSGSPMAGSFSASALEHFSMARSRSDREWGGVARTSQSPDSSSTRLPSEVVRRGPCVESRSEV